MGLFKNYVNVLTAKNRQGKRKSEEVITQNISREEAFKKAVNIINKEINKPENKILKKITKKVGKSASSATQYDNWINSKEYYIDILYYDASKLVGPVWKPEDDDVMDEVREATDNILDRVNKELESDGYILDMSADSELLGPGGFTLEINRSRY